MSENLGEITRTFIHFITQTLPDMIMQNPYIGVSATLPFVIAITIFLWRSRTALFQVVAHANGEVHSLRDQVVQAEMQKRSELAQIRTAAAAELFAVQSRLAHVEQRYKGIINVDEVIARREQDRSILERDIKDLRHEYAHKRKIFDALTHEISTLEGRLDFAELGMYQQSLQFDTSAEYAIALAANKDRQKEMISAGTAVVCSIEWTVNGSKREGKTMSGRAIRMVLRAFNNECEVIIGKVTWKNYDASRERISKSAEAINKLNESNHIGISDQYIKLKVDELRLT
jgi:hypothetical protein